MDNWKISSGAVIATLKNSQYPNRAHGNHEAFYLYSGREYPKTRTSVYIVVIDQWTRKGRVSARNLFPSVLPKMQSGMIDGSDNAAMFHVAQ